MPQCRGHHVGDQDAAEVGVGLEGGDEPAGAEATTSPAIHHGPRCSVTSPPPGRNGCGVPPPHRTTARYTRIIEARTTSPAIGSSTNVLSRRRMALLARLVCPGPRHPNCGSGASMNSHDHEPASPVMGLRSSDDLHRIVSELLVLAACQDRITRQYAQLADQLQALADAEGWLAGEREGLGEQRSAESGRLSPYDVSIEQATGARRVEAVTSQSRDPDWSRRPAPLPRQMRLPGDPGS